MRQIEINAVVTVPDDITEDIMWDKFTQFIEDNKWTYGGGIVDVTIRPPAFGFPKDGQLNENVSFER